MSTLRYERQGSLGILRLDKARGNAIDDALLEDMARWIVEATRDDQLRGVLLASAHPKLFCPGLDLVSLVDRDREAMRDFMNRFATVLWGLFGLLKPVVAAINGPAVAGGCILAMAADARVIARGAPIGLNEVKIGVPLPFGVARLLQDAVPPHSLAAIGLLGRNFRGEAAREAGLVHEVCSAARFQEVCLARAEEFASKDPAAFAATKRYLRAGVSETLRAADALYRDEWLDCWFGAAARRRIEEIVSELQARRG